ncbi:hypothetical protein C2G38_864429 [Gigaspora rosea]|uniref:Uncharacterized protein n=1 Tax=Gigaspora rosea TaxID=44941 RepID=A0A397VNB4_9GLOM|nr:hypothetical protein C2G38_864429 [Gigaspora rosea]
MFYYLLYLVALVLDGQMLKDRETPVINHDIKPDLILSYSDTVFGLRIDTVFSGYVSLIEVYFTDTLFHRQLPINS